MIQFLYMQKGFSILEIIITIAISGIVLAIVTNSYQISQIKKTQEQIVEEIVASLDEQKAQSQTGKNSQNYGIKFNSNEFILFTGTEFASNAEANKIIAVNSQFEITDTISNTDNIIYFSKLLGDANEKATITITHIDNRIPQKNIVIEKTGTISVIE